MEMNSQASYFALNKWNIPHILDCTELVVEIFQDNKSIKREGNYDITNQFTLWLTNWLALLK